MELWGWIWLLMPLWDSWGGPLGRIGPTAYLVEGPKGEVYLGEGRRLWRLEKGSWEAAWLLPGEGRAGVIDRTGRLWVVGLNALYKQEDQHFSTIPLAGAGWGEAVWLSEEGLAVKAALLSYWMPFAGVPVCLPGNLVGIHKQGLWVQKQDTLLRGYPDRWEKISILKEPLRQVTHVGTQVWTLTAGGRLRPLLSAGESGTSQKVRLVSAIYYLSENRLYQVGSAEPLWRSETDVYALQVSSHQDLIWILRTSGVTALYLSEGMGWQWQFPLACTGWERAGPHWVVWQGETAFLPALGSARRYKATLLGATYYKGRWLWATPQGLVNEEGEIFSERGYYIKAVAAQGEQLAWAIGREIFLQDKAGQRRRYSFPMAVQGVGWTGDTLWVWGSDHLYWYENAAWRGEKVGAFLEEGRIWEGRLCVRVGSFWLYRRAKGWDTLSRPPWLEKAWPTSPTWGSLLSAWQTGESRHLLLSHGLIQIEKKRLRLPPLRLEAGLEAPALRQVDKQVYRLPAAEAYISLRWQAYAPFLPMYAAVRYQIGEQPSHIAEGRALLLSLGEEGEVPVTMTLSHPWYAQKVTQQWLIQVVPPWYRTLYAKVGLVILVGLLIGGVIGLREWYHRRLRQSLQAERAALAQQVQHQQGQILQNERMANLGVMAAHIAHEINTPLGVIRSSVEEVQRRLEALQVFSIRPAQPPQSPAQTRELRDAWQASYPHLPPYVIQQLAALGFTPHQWEFIQPYTENPEKFQAWLSWIEVTTYLHQARVAIERLQERVQRIRSYVRDIRESPGNTRLSLQESLIRTLTFYQPLLRKVQVETSWPEETLYIEGDPARLDQVWANLIQNALQAMGTSAGCLHIRIKVEEGMALVLIQDNGPGIPAAVRDRIFDPLFTTKAPGEGTGLGLPICRQIVEAHGGWIRLLHSEPGYTLFGVGLPIVSPPQAAETAHPPPVG